MFSALIADDENLERKAIKKILENHCPEITEIYEASNGIEALAQFEAHSPDIMFCDIQMPGKTGLEVVQEIKALKPEQQIVFLTAYDYFDYAKKAVSLGVTDYLLKPVDNEEIKQISDKMLSVLIEKQKIQEEEKKKEQEITFYNDFFKNEYLKVFLEKNPVSLDEYFSVFPDDMKVCIAGAFKIINLNMIEISEKTLLLFINRALQYLKDELNKRQFTFFIHYDEKKGNILLFTETMEIFEENGKKIKEIFLDLEKNIKRKFSIDVIFSLKIIKKKSETIRSVLLETSEIIGEQKETSVLNDEIDYHKLQRYYENTDKQVVKKITPRLVEEMENVARFIQENYLSKITLEKAASTTHLSSFYFSKIFKQYFGMSFSDYLNDCRLKKACDLLLNPKFSIKEVAEMTGYPDQNYFSRVFQKLNGMTPSEFRNKSLKDTNY